MTLNQVIRRIQTLTTDHKQIRSFQQNKLSQEFLNDKTTRYPCALLQGTDGSISTANKSVSLSFRLFLLDLVHVSEDTKSNELDVQSDMLSVAMDLVAQMNYPGFDDWILSTDNNLQLLAEEQNDMVAGCYFDFSLRAMFTQNVCQVPTTLTDYSPIDTDMKQVYDETYLANGSEGSTLTIPAIKGKKILLIIRENNPLYKVSNSPESTEYTWDLTDIGLGTPVNPAGERFLILYRNL